MIPGEQKAPGGGASSPDTVGKLRILHTCMSPSWGGLEMAALDLAGALKRRGHDVTIACLEKSRMSGEALAKDVAVLGLVPGRYLHPANVWRLRQKIRHGNIDLIHAHVSGDLPSVVMAVKLAGRRPPILLTKGIGSGIKKTDPFHLFLYANVSCVLAVSRFVQRNVVETTPVPKDRVVLLFNGLDTDRFSPGNARRAEVRREFGISDNTLLIGFVGRFSPGKGHEEFLRAAQQLSEKYDQVQFLIVGEASFGEEKYARTIKEMCSTLGLDQRVTFAGYRSDIPDVMAAFDIFAFPSHAESFGLGLIEAMAMERPVVATRKDGTLDIVVDGETGYFVPARDVPALASALARLIDDADLREKMGKAGRRRVEELFSQNGQVRRLEKLYINLCSTIARHHTG
jgi:glycosyltransferase involved in cell wall biosynthesis